MKKILLVLLFVASTTSVLPQGTLEATHVISVTEMQPPHHQAGVYRIRFELTAVESDAYITPNTAFSSSSTYGFNLLLETGGQAANTAATVTAENLPSSDFFKIDEGKTEAFVLQAYVVAQSPGYFGVTLNNINWSSAQGGELNSLPVDFGTLPIYLQGVPEPRAYILWAIGALVFLLARSRRT